jgi:hypothetical protein
MDVDLPVGSLVVPVAGLCGFRSRYKGLWGGIISAGPACCSPAPRARGSNGGGGGGG